MRFTRLGPAFAIARHFGTAIVPARAKRPRDKALVENAKGVLAVPRLDSAMGAQTIRLDNEPLLVRAREL